MILVKGQKVQGTEDGKNSGILEAEITNVYTKSARFDYEILVDKSMNVSQVNTHVKVYADEIEATGNHVVTYEGKKSDIAFLMGMTSTRG